MTVETDRRSWEHLRELAASGDREALDEATSRNLEYVESDASHRSHLRELQVKQENRRERIGILAEDREAILREGETAGDRLAEMAAVREETAGRRAARPPLTRPASAPARPAGPCRRQDRRRAPAGCARACRPGRA